MESKMVISREASEIQAALVIAALSALLGTLCGILRTLDPSIFNTAAWIMSLAVTTLTSWYYVRRIQVLRAQCFVEHGTSMYVFLRAQLRATTTTYVLTLLMANLTVVACAPCGTYLFNIVR